MYLLYPYSQKEHFWLHTGGMLEDFTTFKGDEKKET